jgi:hypothetical protein
MSTDREVTAIVRSWMQEGRTTLPDRVLDDVLDRLPATPQRRPFWPARRSNRMTTLRLVLATAAVIVLAIAGINLTFRPNVATEPTSPPSPTPTESPTPSPLSIARGGTGGLDPGRYVLADVFPFKVTFTIATDWEIYDKASRNFIAIYKDNDGPPTGKGVIIGIVDNVFADACDSRSPLLDPPIGPTTEDFATAVAGQPRTDASPITDVSLAGYSGSFVEFTTTRPETDCANQLERWPTPAGDRWGLPNLHDRLWILDVDGSRLVIDGWDFLEASDADLAEVRAVVESIEIE